MPKIVDHPARRDEISAIAASLIAEGGMERRTIREIASRSGFSKGVIEHYFEGKEELISAALDSINQGYEQRVHNSAVGLSGLSALRQRILATLPVNRTIRNEWKVRLAFWSIAAIESKLCARQTERFEKAVAVYANDIALSPTDFSPPLSGYPLQHSTSRRRLAKCICRESSSILCNG
jgi:AcrR family transcriptional regulator